MIDDITALIRELQKPIPRHPDKPADPGEWKDVGKSFVRGLKKICVLFEDAVDVVRSTVRGLDGMIGGFCKLPRQLGSRIERSQRAGDKQEATRQIDAARRPAGILGQDEAVEKLEAVLRRCQAKGCAVRAIEQSPGVFTIVVVRPELIHDAIELLGGELKQRVIDSAASEDQDSLDRFGLSRDTQLKLNQIGVFTCADLELRAPTVRERALRLGIDAYRDVLRAYEEAGIPPGTEIVAGWYEFFEPLERPPAEPH